MCSLYMWAYNGAGEGWPAKREPLLRWTKQVISIQAKPFVDNRSVVSVLQKYVRVSLSAKDRLGLGIEVKEELGN